MRKYLVSLFAVALVWSLAAAAYAQDKDWVYLGKAHIDGQNDHKTISVDKGPFHFLRIDVLKEDIEFDHIVVHYGDGQDETVKVRDVIPAGGQSRAIHLEGGERHIKSVEFWYNRVHPSSDKPEVQIYGRP